MKNLLLILTLITISFSLYAQEASWNGSSADFSHGRLKVSENKHFLVFDDGTPFFYLGDTGWELFHRLTKDEAEKYLENRRQKGFTVIQAVALAELDGLNTPNAEGEKPLVDNDPLKPNEKYFAHVDWVIRKAAEKGIFIGLLPTWGDKIDKQWGVGPEIFNADNAFKYGQWIGKRYRDFKNIIWVNGGDRSGGDKNFPVWEALAKGIKSVDKNHLMTHHPMGGFSSSKWFHNSDWLDFNMTQTGHCERSYSVYKTMIADDYSKMPTKPCFDGEPRYEDHPVCWNPGVLGWFDDADVRQAAYWNLFSGGFGHTYGCHAIWQFLAPGREPIGFARNSWMADLDLPGASDLIHIRRLMLSRDFLSRIPDQNMVLNKYMPETDYIVATRGKNYAFIYIPTGITAEVNLAPIGAKQVKVWWYNPRDGKAQFIETADGKGNKSYTPPTRGRGNDWLLVIDDAAANYPEPGK